LERDLLAFADLECRADVGVIAVMTAIRLVAERLAAIDADGVHGGNSEPGGSIVSPFRCAREPGTAATTLVPKPCGDAPHATAAKGRKRARAAPRTPSTATRARDGRTVRQRACRPRPPADVSRQVGAQTAARRDPPDPT